jgi:MYXO-CTERM domain-containing protein
VRRWHRPEVSGRTKETTVITRVTRIDQGESLPGLPLARPSRASLPILSLILFGLLLSGGPLAGTALAGTDCQIDSDCDPNERCDQHTCLPVDTCVNSGDCGSGQVCYFGGCVPSCGGDSDCLPGNKCQAGACVPLDTVSGGGGKGSAGCQVTSGAPGAGTVLGSVLVLGVLLMTGRRRRNRR